MLQYNSWAKFRVMISTSDRKGQSLREEGIQVHVSFLSGQVSETTYF